VKDSLKHVAVELGVVEVVPKAVVARTGKHQRDLTFYRIACLAHRALEVVLVDVQFAVTVGADQELFKLMVYHVVFLLLYE
jgi:hypothetical protein